MKNLKNVNDGLKPGSNKSVVGAGTVPVPNIEMSESYKMVDGKMQKSQVPKEDLR